MKNNQRNSIFKNINYETRLLESLDWDEEMLSNLYSFIFTALDQNYKEDFIINKIKENFTDAAALIIKETFEKEKEKIFKKEQ